MPVWRQMVLLHMVEFLHKTVFWARNSQMEGFVSFKFIYAVFADHLPVLSFDGNGCTIIDGTVSEATAFPSFEAVTFDLKSCMHTQNGLYFIAGKSSPSSEKYSNPFSHGVYIKSHVYGRSTSKIHI